MRDVVMRPHEVLVCSRQSDDGRGPRIRSGVCNQLTDAKQLHPENGYASACGAYTGRYGRASPRGRFTAVSRRVGWRWARLKWPGVSPPEPPPVRSWWVVAILK
ncbi:hypothetical protein JTE90_015822 [Oedothorax gibbosus]|uniref:Uncharacterized protein n=1 Tax=Oedothorax gibbosus TaxID=931172 RepID=A0AAV6TGX9_9ARAC|nr:hypothetical protein JTE90_015822 [Oedothorax gibbosus]